jgi:hypothetical protein
MNLRGLVEFMESGAEEDRGWIVLSRQFDAGDQSNKISAARVIHSNQTKL